MDSKPCCENCAFSMQVADIEGLLDCDLDGHSVDWDMVCDAYKKKDTTKARKACKYDRQRSDCIWRLSNQNDDCRRSEKTFRKVS